MYSLAIVLSVNLVQFISDTVVAYLLHAVDQVKAIGFNSLRFHLLVMPYDQSRDASRTHRSTISNLGSFHSDEFKNSFCSPTKLCLGVAVLILQATKANVLGCLRMICSR